MNKAAWIRQLIREGLDEVDAKYGPAGPHPLPYHNVEHTRDVMRAAKALATEAAVTGKVDRADIPLLELAACYHDIEHDQPGRNEEASADILTTKMIAAGVFSEPEISLCRSCILATAYRYKGDKIIQAATDDYRTKLLADADLANVGRPFSVSYDRSMKYYAEHAGHELSPDEQKQTTAPLMKFMKKHRFHTPEAEKLFPHKVQNLAYLKTKP